MKRYVECMEVREDFSALLDGELASEEREQVEAHLSECSECLRELNALKQVDDAYSALGSVSAPTDFEKRVQQAIRPRTLPFPSWVSFGGRGWMRPVTAIAALLLVMFGATYLLRPTAQDRFQTASVPESGRATLRADVPLASAESVDMLGGLMKEESAQEPEAVRAMTLDDAKKRATEGTWKSLVQPRPNVSDPRQRKDVAELEMREKKVDSALLGVALENAASREVDFQRAVNTSVAAAKSPPAPVEQAADRLESLGYVADDAGFSISPETLKARNEILGVPNRRFADDETSFGERDQIAAEASPADSSADAPPPARQNIEELVEQAQVEGQAVVMTQLRSFSVDADGTWIEKGYAGEKTTVLKRESQELRDLTARYPQIARILRRPARTIFELEGRWYALDAAEEID